MKTVIIKRDDFNGHRDSTGREYFDYILSSIGIAPADQDLVDEVRLEVSSFTAEDDEGDEVAAGKLTCINCGTAENISINSDNSPVCGSCETE